MNERFPGSPEASKEKSTRQELLAMGRELSEKNEKIPFPGIDPEAYTKIKASEQEFPGYVTPIDELLERFRTEGMRVVTSETPNNLEVFLVPFDTGDIGMDSLFPRHLILSEEIDENLRKLIDASRNR